MFDDLDDLIEKLQGIKTVNEGVHTLIEDFQIISEENDLKEIIDYLDSLGDNKDKIADAIVANTAAEGEGTSDLSAPDKPE